MSDNDHESARITASSIFQRTLLQCAFVLLACSQAAIALMFFHAEKLGLYPFGSPSDVNGVGHWENDVLESLLGTSALSITVAVICALAALDSGPQKRRALSLVWLSIFCALVLMGVGVVMFGD